MSRPNCLSGSRGSPSRSPLMATAVTLVLSGSLIPSGLAGQSPERWNSTDDDYDAGRVAAHVEQLGAQLAERHGPLAETLFAMNADLASTPHFLSSRVRGPYVAPIKHRVEAAHLVHYQAASGGSLGWLHGTTEHPLGVGWVPHSMFAESGRLFGQWGHARLLAAVDSHADRHRD